MGEVIKTVCSTCYCGCGVLAQVENGRVVKIKGDPEHPYSQGALCPKGYSSLELLYHPDRLNYPLQRVGERGEGKWQRISWDEALSTIANKLNETKARYGPEANSISAGAWIYGNTGITAHFGYLIGTPNWVNLTHICFGPMATATRTTIGYFAGINVTETLSNEVLAARCILLWGANPRASAPYPLGEGIFEVKKAGTKLIVVDPRPTDYAKEADIWLRIRPGTDAALALGMMNIIINEALYDQKFVNEWCFGFEKLREHVNEYPPEKVSKITWIPESDIKKAARMFATNRPSCLCQRVSLDQSYNSVHSSRATLILTAICGNLDLKGGNLLPGMAAVKSEFTVGWIEGLNNLPPLIKEKRLGAKEVPLYSGADVDGAMVHPTFWANAVLTGIPYPIKTMIALNNLVLPAQDAKKIWQALNKLDFLATVGLFMTPTAELADIVLPAACWLERDGIRSYPGHPYLTPIQHRAVTPQYERWDDVKVFIELAKKMELDIPWRTVEDFNDHRLKPMSITFKELKDKNFITIPKEYQRHEKGKFQFLTPSKKVELYSTFLEEKGYDPLPPYIAPPETSSEFPLILIGGRRSMEYIHSSGRQLSMLRKVNPDPTIEINPETAREKDIRDGDWVWVETVYFDKQERVKFKAKLVKELHPLVVCAENGWWFPEMPGPEHGCFESNINVIIPDDVYEPMYGSTNIRSVPSRIYKALAGLHQE